MGRLVEGLDYFIVRVETELISRLGVVPVVCDAGV